MNSEIGASQQQGKIDDDNRLFHRRVQLNAIDDAKIDHRLYNDDLRPLESNERKWGAYNIFAVWMSVVHSVATYLGAASLFSLRLVTWQVFFSLIVGIVIVQIGTNLASKPSQVTGVPYPVINRSIFGIRGAFIPALINGVVSLIWYGVQTYLGSRALQLIVLRFFPSLAAFDDVKVYGFVGLSLLGWILFMVMWLMQALVFWNGMDAIRRFADWAGPAVYVVMLLLTIYLVSKAGISNLSFTIGKGEPLGFMESIPVMFSAISLVVMLFSVGMLNFGDYARYVKSWEAMKLGNFLGLPINYMFFALLTVITTSATLPVFGEIITDPIETVSRIDSSAAIVVGGITFIVATVGINIVANFVGPAFDFSNLFPRLISWRTGGIIGAVGSILLTPWNWYNNPDAIQYTAGVIGSLIGPLYGILIAGHFVINRQQINIAALYSSDPASQYWFRNGFNWNAILALIFSALLSIVSIILPKCLPPDSSLHRLADFSGIIGGVVGFFAFILLERAGQKFPWLKHASEPQKPGENSSNHDLKQNNSVPKTINTIIIE